MFRTSQYGIPSCSTSTGGQQVLLHSAGRGVARAACQLRHRGEGTHADAAGDLSGLVPSHAVGHREDRIGSDVGILVHLPPQPAVGTVADVEPQVSGGGNGGRLWFHACPR
jgi:hypothetical protein